MNYYCKKCGSGHLKIDSTFPYHNIQECVDCKHIGHYRIEDCCRQPFLIVAIMRLDHDSYMLYHQCLTCGGAVKTKPLKANDYLEQLRCEFNQERFDGWKSERKAESNQIYENLRHANYKNTRGYRYHTYLRSDEWKAKRLLVLRRANHLCEICHNENASDIHHLTYENLCHEPLEDLLALCRMCHFNLHRPE